MTRVIVLGGLALLALLVATTPFAGCTVRRASSELACFDDVECTGGRRCDRGFCVASTSSTPCPSGCTSCDLDTLRCNIDCDGSNPDDCNFAFCPAGFDCVVHCAAGACGSVFCSSARSCEIHCKGAGACDSVSCGSGKCDVECDGPLACSSVQCYSSCACDVQCAVPSACPSMGCPSTLQGSLLARCTETGMEGSPCDSSKFSDCASCP